MCLVLYTFYFIFLNIYIRKIIVIIVILMGEETKIKAMQLVSSRTRILSYATCTLLYSPPKYKTWAHYSCMFVSLNFVFDFS